MQAPTAPDLVAFTRLHTFVVLSDLLRKWWKLELFLADAEGEPVRPEQRVGHPSGAEGQRSGPPSGPASGVEGQRAPGRPYTAANEFCRLTLHAPEGARRCAESMRVTMEKLHAAGRGARFVTHECHMGFDVLARSVWLDGALCGFVAVSGSVHGALSPFAETQILRKLREVVPAAGNGTDLERAMRRVPLLSQGEMEQVADLLALCADEIEAHHEQSRAGSGPAPAAPPAYVQDLLQRMERLEREMTRLSQPRAALGLQD